MGRVVRTIAAIGLTVASVVTMNPALAKLAWVVWGTVLLETAAKTVLKKPQQSLSAFDPKQINADTGTPRKLVFGRTAFPMDLRYAEPSGTNQEYIDYIFALAAHKSDAIESIYFEDDLAWTLAGGAQGKFAGYLTIEVILEAGAGAYHTVNGGAIWGASQRLTGCTTMKVRIKRSDNSKTSQSPFASGIAGQWTVIGRGMAVYDPARDSTVAGGSGSQRANDQTTWAYTVSSVARGNNPALQLLAYMLGWKIGGVGSVGCGQAADVLDLPSFAVAAALCDESVALAAGGTQRRYEAGRAFSDGDDPPAVIRLLLDAMNGELVDDGGRLALRIAVNDLTAAYTLTDDDFVSGYGWRPVAPIGQQFTVVRGKFSQPDAPSLFALVDFPEVAIARASLAPRPMTIDLSAVQEQRRAERIAKQTAQRNLYQGEFSVTLGVRGWLLRRNMVVAITSTVRGWTAKLFRVRALTFNADATVNAVFREEHASIYAWSASESALVTPVSPVVFDSRKAASWLMADIAPGANLTATANANRVPFSGFPNRGWVANGPGAGALSYFTFEGKRAASRAFTATTSAQLFSIQNNPAGVAAFPVTAGELLFVAARLEASGAVTGWQLNVGWIDSAGGVSEAAVASGSGAISWTSARRGGFITAPAGTVGGYIRGYAISSGAGAVSVVLSEPLVTGATAGQTVVPAYTPGPNAEEGADVTVDQTIVSRLDSATGRAADNFQAGGTGAPFAQLVASGNARDGDVVSFPSTLPSPPKIFFLPGGNAGTAGQNLRIKAEGLTASGFTMVAKSQAVTAGSTITDSPSSAGGSGEPARVINRSNSGAPFDGTFSYRVAVTVNDVVPGEPGSITLAFFAKIGGSWQEAARQSFTVTGNYDVEVSPGTVDFGAGNEFGVTAVASEGAGTVLSDFVHVRYILGTVTQISLTPSGASAIPWQAFL
jgi:hypothetical protein